MTILEVREWWGKVQHLLTRCPNSDIQVLKTYGAAPYAARLKSLEKDIKDLQTKVNEKIGMSPECAKVLKYSSNRWHRCQGTQLLILSKPPRHLI